jgi:hypothetical protein
LKQSLDSEAPEYFDQQLRKEILECHSPTDDGAGRAKTKDGKV